MCDFDTAGLVVDLGVAVGPASKLYIYIYIYI